MAYYQIRGSGALKRRALCRSFAAQGPATWGGGCERWNQEAAGKGRGWWQMLDSRDVGYRRRKDVAAEPTSRYGGWG